MTIAGSSRRIVALDFTKGALVLFMVLYHWFNYFYGPQGDFYKYLRFLTPSFICITGFLVSYLYLPRFRSGDQRIPKRIAIRGLKLLVLFLILNTAISMLLSQSYSGKIFLQPFSAHNLVSVYVVGNTLIVGQGKAVAFYILLPISYLLLMSSGLLVVSRYYRYTFQVTSLLFVIASTFLTMKGYVSPNLQLITIGLLGVMAGYIAVDKINAFLSRWWLLLIEAYLLYTLFITFHSVGYVLQAMSVFLHLLLLYLVGTIIGENGRGNLIVLLGKYSLFGYIIQIAILQVLHRIIGHIGFGTAVASVALVVAAILTLLSVVVLDQARVKRSPVDTLYRAVFS